MRHRWSAFAATGAINPAKNKDDACGRQLREDLDLGADGKVYNLAGEYHLVHHASRRQGCDIRYSGSLGRQRVSWQWGYCQ